jgi:signal transduction histidine kinase
VLSSLTNRVFVASALLVVISTGAAMYFVQRAVSARAESELSVRLDEAASLVDAISRTQFTDFIVKAQLVGNLPVLRGAAATEDPATVQPIADEYQQMLRADLFVVAGRGGIPLARAGRSRLSNAEIAVVMRACQARPDSTAFWPMADGLLHVVTIPLEAGSQTLIVGTRLDREAAESVKAVTDTEIAFLRGTDVLAATIPLGRTAQLRAVADRPGVYLVPAGREEYLGRLQALGGDQAADAPTALVLRSRSELTRFLRQLRWQLAGTGAAAVLVATLVGYGVARTVTRPLRALTGTMQEVAATGDLGRRLPALGRWDDEDVRVVAATFGRLTAALNRFQREVSARERLSSLGRLSAVIAHEIRNPLMIIKSSVRALRRHPTPEVAAAADSIDEEVGRVNRVVSGVLDFARPIAFDIGQADLVDIGRAAVQAVMAGNDDVPVIVEGIRHAPAETDVERLRFVLVNLLGNAQQAIRSLPPDGRPSTPVALSVAPLAGGGWRLSVRDDGPGIATEHLPRIFDPFFTTRDTGSGLGLAIARNVIEGLGGTIAVESQPGAGTTVTIELPGRGTMIERQA